MWKICGPFSCSCLIIQSLWPLTWAQGNIQVVFWTFQVIEDTGCLAPFPGTPLKCLIFSLTVNHSQKSSHFKKLYSRGQYTSSCLGSQLQRTCQFLQKLCYEGWLHLNGITKADWQNIYLMTI